MHLPLAGAVVEEAFVENGEHRVQDGRVRLEDFVEERDRGGRQESRRAAAVLVLSRETHLLQKRDTSVTQAIEAVGRSSSCGGGTHACTTCSRARSESGPKISSGVVKRVSRRWKKVPPHKCARRCPRADLPAPGV